MTANDRTYFEELLVRANAANQQLEQRRQTVDAILAVTSQNDPGPTTLKQSIKHLNSEKMLLMVQEATRVRQQKLRQTIQEQSDVIFKAEAERRAAETQLRVQQEKSITHAASRKSKDLEKDEELARAKAQKRQLEKDFVIDLREIKTLLGTFFADGYAQPVTGDPLQPIQMKWESWHIPVKLGRLRSAGALEQTTDGNENLYFFGGTSGNDRPKTGFPNHTPNGLSNPAVARKVKRASELLNKYGDLLVAKKLLAP